MTLAEIMQASRVDDTAQINAEKTFLVDIHNHAANVSYVNNLKALEAANKEILAANALVPAVAGAAMVPGTIRPPFPYTTERVRGGESLTLNSGEYGNQFFESDALGKNHNGVTQVAVPYGGGGGAAVVTMTHFYDQITQGKPDGNNFVAGSFQDALSYYARQTGNAGDMYRPLHRYKMPTFHYRTDTAGGTTEDTLPYYTPVAINSALPYFSSDETNGTLYTTDDGTQPTTNSFEARSLQKAFTYFRSEGVKVIRRKMMVTFKGYYNQLIPEEPAPPQNINGTTYGQVPMRILPNYLWGASIRNSEPKKDGNTLCRPLFSASDPGINDVWCKIFPQDSQPDKSAPGFLVPYDRKKFYIPKDYDLVEDWTGFIRFIDKAKNTYCDMPEGAVMMGTRAPLNTTTPEAQKWMNFINPAIATTLAAFFNEPQHVLEMFPANAPEYEGNMMSDMMGLAIYVYNMRLIGIALRRRPAISGGYTKKNITSKKTRNMNKRQRQRQRRSKSKSMSMFKSAKRAFYRTNKRNKTSRR